METKLSNEQLKFIARKCTGENLVAFVSEVQGVVGYHECKNCGGAGSIVITFCREGAGQISKWHQGKRFAVIDHTNMPCVMCGADTKQRIDYMLELSGVPKHEWDWSIHYIKGIAGKEYGYKAACSILADVPMPKGLYLFFGDFGVGKSGLMKSITVALIRAGIAAVYISAQDILTSIKATYNQTSTITEEGLLSSLAEARFLAIDEIDVIGSTEWSTTTLRNFIDKRYELRPVACTILATNKPPDQLWPYLASRCEDGYRIPIAGKSLRGSNAPVPTEPNGEIAESWWTK